MGEFYPTLKIINIVHLTSKNCVDTSSFLESFIQFYEHFTSYAQTEATCLLLEMALAMLKDMRAGIPRMWGDQSFVKLWINIRKMTYQRHEPVSFLVPDMHHNKPQMFGIPSPAFPTT